MNDPKLACLLPEIPQLPQRQDSLDEQLTDLSAVAVRLGMYVADDWLKDLLRLRARSRGCSIMAEK